MRIDLPRCNFKNCRYCFDSNCTKNTEYERCGFRLAKTEAIKEFAEKLKESISNMEYRANVQRKTVSVETLYTQVNWVFREIVPKTIDAFVKEMTEEHNGNV